MSHSEKQSGTRAARIVRTAGYWLVSLTWGSIMTLLGAVIALGMLLTGHRPRRLGPNVYFEVGRGWGGMEYGAFFFVERNAARETILHEAGHGIQNLLLGPLMPFVVCIPSALRYWMRLCSTFRGKKIFSGVLFAFAAAVGAALCGAAVGISGSGAFGFLLGAGIFFLLYGAALAAWMFGAELPKYREGSYVPYDAIWFEGSATRLGVKYYG